MEVNYSIISVQSDSIAVKSPSISMFGWKNMVKNRNVGSMGTARDVSQCCKCTHRKMNDKMLTRPETLASTHDTIVLLKAIFQISYYWYYFTAYRSALSSPLSRAPGTTEDHSRRKFRKHHVLTLIHTENTLQMCKWRYVRLIPVFPDAANGNKNRSPMAPNPKTDYLR